MVLGRLAAGAAVLLAASVARAAPARWEGVLTGTVTWSGDVVVTADVWVPPGSRLVVEPGTRILFLEAPSTKTDPVFWQPGTELAVGGALEVRGEPGRPVLFEGEGAWGGIVAAPGGRVALSHARIRGAREGLLCVGARCELRQVRIRHADYGLVSGPGARVTAVGSAAESCRVGVLEAGGRMEGEFAVRSPEDAGRLDVPGLGGTPVPVSLPPAQPPRVEYVGEYTVSRPETWEGEVIVTGRVTVTPEAVLTLRPGTRVRFRRVDTNGDGLGEGELLVLGGIRSLGTPERPVVFESAEAHPRPGDWDKVSLIAAEDPDNRFRYTVFRHGVQALHAHFSRFEADSCLFVDNMRAVQFQESDRARIVGSVFVRNKQALRFRDSVVEVLGNRLWGNLYGVHAFRADLRFEGNFVEGSPLGSFLAKESRVAFVDNRIGSGRDGARMKDPDSRAEIRGNRIEGVAEDALSLSRVEAVVEGNLLDRSGLDLVSLEAGRVILRRNRFGRSGRHAVHLKGGVDVDARENFWSGSPPARIHDREDDPLLGRVFWRPVLEEPPPVPSGGPAW